MALQNATCEALKKITRDWHEERIPVTDGILRYWRSEPDQLASAVLVDFRMPHATGIEVLSMPELKEWRGGKLLLTAHADDHVAVEAFNGSLISQFVSKQMIGDELPVFVATVSGVARAGNEMLQRAWSAQVTNQQQSILNACSSAICKHLRELQWTQHAVVGEPFGILGRTQTGATQWLQLETNGSLAALLELADTLGVDSKTKRDVADRKCLIRMEVGNGQEAGLARKAIEFGDQDCQLLGAVFDVHQT